MFLVVLALLLPIRGAVAGAMLCPEGSHSAALTESFEHAGHNMHGDAIAAHHHDHADSTPHHEPSESAGHTSGCGICATVCSMTPILSAMPTVEPSTLAAAVTFPALSAPTPTFQSDGQDRPPRSL